MGLFSFFKSGNYFDKNITPKCDYCRHGKRAKDGNKVLCEHRGLVDTTYSCSKFIYSPLKRIPVKQLNFVGSLADEDLYIESAGDRAAKEPAEEKTAPTHKKQEESAKKPAETKPAPAPEAPAKPEEKPAEAPTQETPSKPEEKPTEAPAPEAPAEPEESSPAPDQQ